METSSPGVDGPEFAVHGSPDNHIQEGKVLSVGCLDRMRSKHLRLSDWEVHVSVDSMQQGDMMRSSPENWLNVCVGIGAEEV